MQPRCLYDGGEISVGSVALTTADVEAIRRACATADLELEQKTWVERAQRDDGIIYFAITVARRPVGQIMLHDIESHEAMVGYHIFSATDRGRGYGSDALSAVCGFAFEKLGLERLVVITTLENAASRRIAERCGFVEIGPAREGPNLVGYELRRRHEGARSVTP